MKKIFIIIGGVLFGAMLLSIVYMVVSDSTNTPQQGVQQNITFPIASDVVDVSSSSALSVRDVHGSDIQVDNFMQNNDTYADTHNTGYFYLGNTFPQTETESVPPFVVTYIEETQFFNVTLTKEPIRDSRLLAETHLKNVLDITEGEMCNLQYTLSVPGYVNEAYSGVDLKFSFCPGSVPL